MLEQVKIKYTNRIKALNNIENIEKLTKKVLGEALKKEQVPYNFFLLIVFVSPDEIREKNRKYRGVDKTTDVLSFPVFEKSEITDIIKYSKNNENLPINLKLYTEDEWSFGEIYVNLEKVEEQSIEYNHSITRELAYILVHGFYHLLGEDHIKDEDKTVMRKKEEELLKNLGIVREDDDKNG